MMTLFNGNIEDGCIYLLAYNGSIVETNCKDKQFLDLIIEMTCCI